MLCVNYVILLSYTGEFFFLSCCHSIFVAPAKPTVKRQEPLPPELQFLVNELASQQQTEKTVSAPGVYHSYFFSPTQGLLWPE